jgi:hypothetical protein
MSPDKAPSISSVRSAARAGFAPSTEAADTGARLARLAELAEELGADRLARDARDLEQRLVDGRFYVACIGQFKRGKSTLIGALIGDPILPAGVVPVTTVPTVIRFGDKRSARIRFRTGTWSEIDPGDLHLYVSEEHNPENTKGVEGVEVFVPSPLLATGMCFVDTPGLGSIFAGNTAATQALVPHIDAALAVIGADPPLAGDELELVEEVSKHVHDLVFVLNKADRTTDTERSAAAAFSHRMLEERLKRSIGPIHQVSAIEQVERRGPARDWDALVSTLEDLGARSGSRLTQAAGERGTRRIGEQLLRTVAEEREALLRPTDKSDRRIGLLRETAAAAERSLADLGYLFTGEQHRLSRRFEERRDAFLDQVRPVARKELATALAALNFWHGPKLRRQAMRMAQQIARQHVMPWLEAEQFEAEGAYAKTAQRFIELANDFLRRLAETGLPGLALPENAELSERFRTKSRFYFYDFINIAQPASPIAYVVDTVAGLIRARGGIENAAFEFLELLLETNATRVQNDLDERVLESRRRLEAEIRKVLLEVSQVAQRALDHARLAKAAGEAAVGTRLCHLGELEAEMKTYLA